MCSSGLGVEPSKQSCWIKGAQATSVTMADTTILTFVRSVIQQSESEFSTNLQNIFQLNQNKTNFDCRYQWLEYGKIMALMKIFYLIFQIADNNWQK